MDEDDSRRPRDAEAASQAFVTPSRHLIAAVVAQAVGAACLIVVATTGSPWSVAAIGLWFPVYLAVVYREGRQRMRAGRGAARSTAVPALALGLPLLSAFAALTFTQRILSSVHSAVALGATGVAVAGGWLGVVLTLRRRARNRGAASPSSAPRSRTVVAAWLAAALFAIPFAAGAAVREVLENRIAPCEEMAPQVPGAPRHMLNILAEACSQREGDAEVFNAGGIRVETYAGRRDADVATVGEDAVSVLAYLSGVLGAPAFERITIHPVAIPGSVRGMAGPGYLLIDSAELIAPRECGEFRSSAGTRGTCGTWVLAHELAHEWFPGRAGLGARNEQVAWEGTADYLAWDWWRSRFGEADAGKLREDLFHGRMRRAPGFAESNAPGSPPRNLTDSQGRALIYGRGPLAWVAAEERAGREAVRTVLRRSLPREDEVMSVEKILKAAESVPEVWEVLNRWWLDPDFEPGVP
jgi:hypothetical protein